MGGNKKLYKDLDWASFLSVILVILGVLFGIYQLFLWVGMEIAILILGCLVSGFAVGSEWGSKSK